MSSDCHHKNLIATLRGPYKCQQCGDYLDICYKRVNQIEGLEEENRKLRKGLEDIKRHQEMMIGRDNAKMSTIWMIATETLKGTKP